MRIDLMLESNSLVWAESGSFLSRNAPARCKIQGPKVMLTDSVAFDEKFLNSGNLRCASSAMQMMGSNRQVSATLAINSFIFDSPNRFVSKIPILVEVYERHGIGG